MAKMNYSADIVDGLASCFNRLTETQLKRLLWHAKQGTPICCGHNWYQFATSDGAG